MQQVMLTSKNCYIIDQLQERGLLKRLFNLTLIILIGVGCLSQAGCLSKEDILPLGIINSSVSVQEGTEKTVKSSKLLVLSKEKILEKIRRDYSEFRSLKLTADLVFLGPEASPNQNCLARVTYKKPGRLVVQGYKELVPNFFTLTMNYPEFWFYVPRYNTVYTGKVSYEKFLRGFEMQLDPILVEGSFVSKPLLKNEVAEMREVESPYYLLSVFDQSKELKVLKRRLWINRTNAMVEKEVHYSKQGIPKVEFLRNDFRYEMYLSFPRQIKFKQFDKNQTTEIKIKQLSLNSFAPEKMFYYKMPDGVIIETVN